MDLFKVCSMSTKFAKVKIGPLVLHLRKAKTQG